MSETCEMRGAVCADVAILGVGVMKSAGFWGKCADFRRIRIDSANGMIQNGIIRGALIQYNREKNNIRTIVNISVRVALG